MGEIGILLQFLLCIVILWPQTNANVHYDCTEQLNGLLTKKLSVQEFATDLKFQSNLLNDSLMTVVYTADCNFFEGQCDGQIEEIIEFVQAANDILDQYLIVTIIFSFTLDLSTLSQLDPWENTKNLKIPEIVDCLNFELPEETTCADLENINDSVWEKLTIPTKFGLGYSESLVGCLKLLPALQRATTVITFVKFGNTIGATESSGLFRKRFVFLHKINTGFVARAVQPGKEESVLLYYPYPNYLGDVPHRQLLIKYWHEFPFTIIPLLSSQQPKQSHSDLTEYSDEASITPYFYTSFCKGTDGTNWYVPSALETFSQYFQQAMLTYSEWQLLKSEKLREFHSKLSSANPNISLQVIVEYSRCIYNWSGVEEVHKSLVHKGSSQPLPHVVAKTMVFAVLKGNGSYSPKVDVGFARRMSLTTKIGCVFSSSFFGPLELSTTEALVTVSFVDHNNYMLYENSVRSRLEGMKSYRSEILKLQPNADVYIQFLMKATIFNNEVTATCNFEILNVNEYFEAILNWGKLNQIPLILGRAFNSNENQKIGSWLSFLRPHMTMLATRTDTGELHPSFVMRNHPHGINNLTVDPCMDLLTGVDPSDLVPTYFHNDFLGLVFDTTTIMTDNNQRVSSPEYETMLGLILKRFDLIEIVVSDNWKDVLLAINSLVSKNRIEPTKQIIFNGIGPEVQTSWEMEQISSFIEQVMSNIKGDWTSIKGAHFVLTADVSGNDSQILTETIVGIDQTNTGFKIGFVYDSRDCLRLLWSLVVNNPSQLKISNFLDNIDYLVCEDQLDETSVTNPGNEFDTHIYLKRVFQEFKPHLDIYIRIEFDSGDELTPEPVSIERYLRLLSFFKQFGNYYNISYLLVRAFGETGWWDIKNGSDLASPVTYEEKFSVYSGTVDPTSSSPIAKTNSVMFLSIIFGLTVFGLAITSILCIRYKRKTYISEEDIQHFLNGRTHTQGIDDANFRAAAECMKFNADFELSILDINIDSQTVLGFGNFGTVYKGTVKGTPAAIKRPNKSCSKDAFKSVLSEVKVLCYVGLHKNVVCFFGAYVKEINRGILFIATEFCSNGSLESFLRTKKQVVTEQNRQNIEPFGEDFIHLYDLHRFSIEIAEGMEYISEKKIVHTDLSTRNVLLDDALTCKIGDFGLSRKLYEDSTYVKKTQEALPWKWMAYESLTKREFTLKSDAWSYGVTLWEIYSLGSTPYGELSFETDFAENLRNGLRPPNPQFASDEIYSRMKECWNLDAEQRPTFTELSGFFKSLCSSQYAILPLLETGAV